ncbi:putative F-box/LRR-repeat protein At5g54820 isoform X1 [Chenopodium quinoa]|uniref:putative F-box/LRR-repeat protein At5g54820 isoform X1 n=1 Tax=Chenopodium quinoa TaxID=63459 RepID=UPI000B798663|nr:putative F-box/LRR-repeat protein At5g54820 isoform X1 [Chenopodium quinoa]
MGDYISELPDDVVSYILSFLTLRDAVRARLLSRRWRYLPYCRTVLRLDALNVFGNEGYNRVSHRSKFVRLVDQFLDTLRDQILRVLVLHFGLDNEYSSHIDSWILRAVTMGIKELDLGIQNYVFSCYLLCPWMASSLTCLRLSGCQLNLSSCCTSWISHLTTLHMFGVRMNHNDMVFIFSSALNLTSLSLEHCCYPRIKCLKVELVGLKKLLIDDILLDIKLNCPNLEVFECIGQLSNLTLAHLPFLRQAKVFPISRRDGGSSIFAELIRFAPHLKALSFFVRPLVIQPLPLTARISKSCLKQLDLLMLVPYGFDLFGITYFINACPSLEILRLKLRPLTFTRQSPQKEYPDCHHQLKEVAIDTYSQKYNLVELVLYLLRNAVALEKMVIACSDKEKLTTLLQNVNSSAELIIRHNH